jgi:hypothetical protein
MTDPKALARAIAARTKPRFIDTNPKPKTLEERLALAREIAARTPPRFIEIPRERGGGKIHYTEEQLTAMRDGLTAEQYRWKKIRKWRKAAQTGPDEPRPAPPLAVMVGPPDYQSTPPSRFSEHQWAIGNRSGLVFLSFSLCGPLRPSSAGMFWGRLH